MAPRILIVDDNSCIHEDFRKILLREVPTSEDEELAALTEEFFGEETKPTHQPEYDLIFASDGQEALEIVRQRMISGDRIAMAFMDVRMPPGWDGIETIERIWQFDPQIQVVICTAYSDYGLEDIQERLGISDRYVILKKPFDPVEACQLASAMTSKWLREKQVDEYCDHLKRVLQKRTFMLEDTTDRLKEAERTLVQSEKLSSIGQLAAGIAHEMSTPASCVAGNVKLARDQVPTMKELVRLCSEIATKGPTENTIRELQQLNEKINLDKWATDTDLILSDCDIAGVQVLEIARNLRDFARVSNDDLIPWDINTSINAALRILRNELKDRCEVDLQLGTVPTIPCSPGQMNQVFLNLLMNASQAIDDEGKITIKTYTDSHAVCVDITDDGRGIDPMLLEEIFEPFFTTKGQGDGTGLGLSIVRDIITNAQGDIKVSSKLGQGTTFMLRFPAAAPSE